MKKTLLLIAMVSMSLASHAEMRWIGDANGDGKLTVADVEQLVQYVLGKMPLPKDITLLDLNGDKAVTIADVALLVHVLINPSDAKQTWVPDNVTIGGEKGSFD